MRSHTYLAVVFALVALYSPLLPSASSETDTAMPQANIESWPRKYFQPGGGDPFLLYFVYGTISQDRPLSGETYRVARVPEGIEVSSYDMDRHPDVVDTFRQGPMWEALKKDDPNLAEVISKQTSCIVLRGSVKDPSNLDYLRDTVGLITYLLDNGGVGVCDAQMIHWWSPDAWRVRIFTPAGPVPRHHVVILVSDEPDGTVWYHTRGMRKFGRPDLSFRGVGESERDGVVDMFGRFIELQAFGGAVAEGQEIRMRSLPSGLRCFHGGSPDDLDFNNVHIEVRRE